MTKSKDKIEEEVIEVEPVEKIEETEQVKVVEIDELLTAIAKQRVADSKTPKKLSELDKLSVLLHNELMSQKKRLKPRGLHRLSEAVLNHFKKTAPKKG